MELKPETVLKVLSFASENKEELQTILMNLNENDASSGTLPLSEKLVNRLVQSYLREKALPVKLEDPEIHFDSGLVLLCGTAAPDSRLTCLGRFSSLALRFRILQIHISGAKRTIVVRSENGLAFRGLLALAAPRSEAISIQGDQITIDLTGTDLNTAIPDWLTAAFLSCENGYLTLAYQIKTDKQ